MKYQHLDKYITTSKQRNFERNFFLNAEQYEIWEEVEIGEAYEGSATFDVQAEDIKAFSRAIGDDNPLFNEEEYARKTPWGGLIGHPLFFIAVGFYCTGLGRCNWIRTPGCFNPGQINIMHEPFRVGDVITMRLKSTDKWIKRGKHYLQYQQDFINQHETLKVSRWPTLIVPPTRAELRKFIAASMEE